MMGLTGARCPVLSAVVLCLTEICASMEVRIIGKRYNMTVNPRYGANSLSSTG